MGMKAGAFTLKYNINASAAPKPSGCPVCSCDQPTLWPGSGCADTCGAKCGSTCSCSPCHHRRTDRDRRPTAVVPERVHGRGLGRIVLEDGSGTQKHRGSVAQHNGGACTSQC